MGARKGTRADARIGWASVFIAIIAAVATPARAQAADAIGAARILYFEPLHSISDVSGNAAQKTSVSGAGQLSFDAYGRRFDLALSTNERLTDQAQKSGRSSLRLYKGAIDGNPQSWVRLSITRDEVHGMISDGTQLYIIEPAAQVRDALVPPLSADASDTVIFRLADVLIDAGATSCASDDAARPAKGDAAFNSLVQELKSAPVVMQAANAAKRLTVSALGDSLFRQRFPNEQSARDAILTRLNDVDGIFSSQLGIEIRVDGLFVTDSTTDALSATTAPNGLLSELAALRKRSPELNSRGLTHLFTGRDLDGTTIGIAYVDSLCHVEHAAGLTEAQSSWRDALVAAHEIGHNFGADHDGDPSGSCPNVPGGYLMGANITGNDTFSQCSSSRMSARALAATCITSLPPANISIPQDLGTQREAVGVPFEWQLDVSNVGGIGSKNVTAELLVPSTVTVQEAYVPGGSCTSGAGIVQCQLGEVDGSTSRAVHLVLRSDSLGTSSISATVSSSNDAATSNNSGTGSLVIEPEADVAVTLQGPASAKMSEMFKLAYSVVNRAEVGTNNLDFTVELPAGISAANASLGGSNCALEGTYIRCTLPSLAPGATATGGVSVNVATAGDVLLRARVSGSYLDPDATNDMADLTVNVITTAKPMAESSGGGGGGGGGSMGLGMLLGLATVAFVRRHRR